MPSSASYRQVDVLILGAGLSGMRAAIAALEKDPGLAVLVAAKGARATGSSFANRNDTLGMQAPQTPEEIENFSARTVELASPGDCGPGLVEILAQESQERFRELKAWGLGFQRDTLSNKILRAPACFFPHQHSAAVFTNLSAAFAAMEKRFLELGGVFLRRVEVQALAVKSENNGPARILGALLDPGKGISPLAM